MNDGFFNAPTSNELDMLSETVKKTVVSDSPNSKNNKTADFKGDDSFTINCDKKFLDLLSTHFLICNDKIKGKGEDCGFEAYTAESGIIGAFDGCGGLGAKTCSGISNHTEAYLASRAVGSAAKQWFYTNASVKGAWDLANLKESIIANLEICQKYSGEAVSRIKGSMVRPFPSTVAIITFRIINRKLVTEHIWAGDSRTYILDKNGLAQISIDDIKGEDAMSNLTRDGALTNVISADKRFDLHTLTFVPRHPCIMFCATDGCFGYVSSPMEFEHMILSSLIDSKNILEWKQKLSADIFSRSGDDQTIAISAFGFDDFNEFKTYFSERCSTVSRIVGKFNLTDEEGQQQLWEEYKPNYYRYTASKE